MLGSLAANILPSAIPFEIMRWQRRYLTAEQRQSKLPYLGLALTQALFAGIPLTYYALKESPTLSSNDLFTKFIGHCIPGLIWQRVASEIEGDEIVDAAQDRRINEHVQNLVAQMLALNRGLQDIDARWEQLNQEHHQPAQAQISSTTQYQNISWQKEELRKIEEEKKLLQSQQQQIQQKLEEEDCCCICLDDSNRVLQTTTCNHKFHGNCLNTWLEKNSTCPLCRAQIVH